MSANRRACLPMGWQAWRVDLNWRLWHTWERCGFSTLFALAIRQRAHQHLECALERLIGEVNPAQPTQEHGNLTRLGDHWNEASKCACIQQRPRGIHSLLTHREVSAAGEKTTIKVSLLRNSCSMMLGSWPAPRLCSSNQTYIFAARNPRTSRSQNAVS